MAKRKLKKNGANSETPSKTAKTIEVMYDDEEDQLFAEPDVAISASEDEGGSDDERKHRKLLEAISSLGGKKKRKVAERSEATIQVSEFAVSAEGAGEKISLSDLLGTMDQAPFAIKSTKKQLKNLQNRKDTLELPLSRPETEKIQRKVAYTKTSKDVSQWESIVKQNQRAEQLVFPLNQEPSRPKPVEHVVTGWKVRTPLEQEIFSLLHKNMQPVNDPLLTPMEEASLKAMSLEEAKIRRAELQKARALQSYYEAKAKRERKIKSKKFHKVRKKGKQKELLKQFEELRKSDPAAALEELKKMEMARIQERMSLKHQNSGKWAKSKAIMAKYDDEARKAMQEQLEMNKALTQKPVLPSESEEEQEPDEMEVLPDFVNDPQPVVDPANPWMVGKLTAEPAEKDEVNSMENGQKLEEPESEDDDDEEEDEEDTLLQEFDQKRKLRRREDEGIVPSFRVNKEETADGKKEEAGGVNFEDEHENEVLEFNSLFQKFLQKEDKATMDKGMVQDTNVLETEEPPLLEEGLLRVRTLEDVDKLLSEDLATGGGEDGTTVKENVPVPPTEETTGQHTDKTKKKKKKKKVLDCNNVLTKEAKVLSVAMAPTVVDEEEGEENQKMLIQEAFAGDDVVSDFLKDKKKQIEAGKPKVVDLTLPGWGDWGGVGLKPSRRKRKKFRVKVAPAPPRKDQSLPSVIISEAREATLAAHQVNQLPFSFEKPQQFERCIRTPVGHTWNTQRTVQKLTAPKVITQLGSIIEPITRDCLDKNTGKKVPDIVLPSGNSKTQVPPKGKRESRRKRHHKRCQTKERSNKDAQ